LEVIGQGLISLLIQDLHDGLQRLLMEQAAQIRVISVFFSSKNKKTMRATIF
jgi:hypothetical protein